MGGGLEQECKILHFTKILPKFHQISIFSGTEKCRLENTRNKLLKLVLLGFFVQVGYPWAWWSLAWHGWRTSWCLRKDQQGKLHLLLGGPWQQILEIGDQFWSLEQFHAQAVGMATCGSKAQCSSGNDGFLGEQLFLACIGEVSWLHRWLGQIFVLPWWPVVFGELFLQCSFERFAWFVPFFKKYRVIFIDSMLFF